MLIGRLFLRAGATELSQSGPVVLLFMGMRMDYTLKAILPVGDLFAAGCFPDLAGSHPGSAWGIPLSPWVSATGILPLIREPKTQLNPISPVAEASCLPPARRAVSCRLKGLEKADLHEFGHKYIRLYSRPGLLNPVEYPEPTRSQ